MLAAAARCSPLATLAPGTCITRYVEIRVDRLFIDGQWLANPILVTTPKQYIGTL